MMERGSLRSLVATQFLTNAVATYYTLVGMPNDVATVNSIVFANTTAGAVTVTVHNVVTGGTAITGNQIFPAVSIPANTTWVGRYPEDGLCVIMNGGTIQALASANSSVTLTIGGRVYHGG
jgi:hypothetical protein